ncbi:MAG: hypothetical protein IJ437_02320 [Clostridia bacterium]|nr:hypothetical protein [Clostridia bacterium]
MRLFLKHLFRSIRKRPLQPLIITLTILLSVLVMTMSLTIKASLSEEINSVNDSKYGHADIVVNLNNESASRFMFTSDASELLGDRASVVGSYELVFTTSNGGAVTGKAVDFYEVGKLFDFAFSEYSQIKEEEIKSTVIVTSQYMEKNALSLGDTVVLSLFGWEKEYKISAVSKSPLFGDCDIMLDITGVMEALGEKSLFISALGEDFKPYSTLYIDMLDTTSTSDAINELKSSEALANRSFTDVKESQNQGFVGVVLPVVVGVCIFMLAFCGGVIIFSCFYILSRKRLQENEAFSACGTKKSFLNLMQLLEALIYWIIGAPIGLALAIPASYLAGEILSFRYATIKITPVNAIIAISLMLLTAIVTVCIFLFTRDKKVIIKRKITISGVLVSISLVSFFVAMLSKGNSRAILGFFSTDIMLITLFFATPCLFSLLVALFIKAFEKRQNIGKGIKSVSLYYALKNAHRVKVLSNLTRLVSVLLAVLISTLFIVGASNGFVKATESSVGGDYLILNATDRCYDEIKKSPHLDSISKIYKSEIKYENGFTTPLLSSNDKSAFGENIKLDTLPKGNEAIASSSDAKMLELKIGDKITVEADGKELELFIVDIMSIGANAIIFDSAHFGLTPNIISVNARVGEESELLDDITVASAKELATVIPAKNLQKQQIDRNMCLLKCANILLFVAIVFAVIGFANSLYESYMSRKEELFLYSYAGISNVKIFKMILWELVLMIGFGALIGIVGSLVIVPSLDKALGQMHFEVVAYFLHFLEIIF